MAYSECHHKNYLGVTVSNTLADLTNGGKRTKIHDAQMVTKLPAAAKALVTKVATDQGVSEADVVRTALAEYFERRGYRG
jgi:hypothetical protein